MPMAPADLFGEGVGGTQKSELLRHYPISGLWIGKTIGFSGLWNRKINRVFGLVDPEKEENRKGGARPCYSPNRFGREYM